MYVYIYICIHIYIYTYIHICTYISSKFAGSFNGPAAERHFCSLRFLPYHIKAAYHIGK